MVELIVKIEGDDGEPVGELVRCKDCKYAEVPMLNYFKNTHCYCAKYELTEPKDWYCADGVKRDD